MDKYITLRDAHGSQSKFVHLKAEAERRRALRIGTIAPDIADVVEEDTIGSDAIIAYALSDSAVKTDDPFPLPSHNVYKGIWEPSALPSGRIT